MKQILMKNIDVFQAVKIDTTEVTVWYKIGTIAKQIYNFPLARMGFEMVIICLVLINSNDTNHYQCI